ncbi:MAG: ATP-binding protein [Rhodanobacteraceae bacterium]
MSATAEANMASRPAPRSRSRWPASGNDGRRQALDINGVGPRRLAVPPAQQALRATSVIITTNLDVAEWARAFGKAMMITALLDRRTRHRYNVVTSDQLHCFLHSSAATGERVRACNQARTEKTTSIATA